MLLIKKTQIRNEKTYRTQTLKKKVLEETKVFNTFILLYFYSRWSGLHISKSIFQYSQTDADSPTSAKYNEGFTHLFLGQVKWFIGGYRRQEAEQFLPVLNEDLSPLFIKVSVYVPGHYVFFNNKNRDLTSLKNLCSGRVKTDKLDLREGK